MQKKIPLVREMIIAQDYEHRMKAIAKLKPLQTADFKRIFSILGNMPLNIRLLDPPLHEFLPTLDQDKENLARTLGTLNQLLITVYMYYMKLTNAWIEVVGLVSPT